MDAEIRLLKAAEKGCPAHGLTLLKLAPASDLNGIHDDALVYCGGCIEDGATPGGAWSINVPEAFDGS